MGRNLAAIWIAAGMMGVVIAFMGTTAALAALDSRPTASSAVTMKANGPDAVRAGQVSLPNARPSESATIPVPPPSAVLPASSTAASTTAAPTLPAATVSQASSVTTTTAPRRSDDAQPTPAYVPANSRPMNVVTIPGLSPMPNPIPEPTVPVIPNRGVTTIPSPTPSATRPAPTPTSPASASPTSSVEPASSGIATSNADQTPSAAPSPTPTASASATVAAAATPSPKPTSTKTTRQAQAPEPSESAQTGEETRSGGVVGLLGRILASL